jgi:hypothetical protein
VHDFEGKYACLLCWDSQFLTIDNCLKKLINSSNAVVHMTRQHSMKEGDLKVPPTTHPHKRMKTLRTSLDNTKKPDAVVNTLHQKISVSINDNGLSDRVCEVTKFRDIIDYCISNVKTLQSAKKVHIGRDRYNKIRLDDLSRCFGYLEDLVSKNREIYLLRLGKICPFVHVAHDGYEKDTRDALGVSIFFIDRSTWTMVNAGVGLIEMAGKGAAIVSKLVLDLLAKELGSHRMTSSHP